MESTSTRPKTRKKRNCEKTPSWASECILYAICEYCECYAQRFQQRERKSQINVHFRVKSMNENC